MKSKTLNTRSLLASFVVVTGIVATTNSFGQTAAPGTDAADPSQEISVLKPFEVTAASGEGYRVSSSSTATRTNTSLIDIPQSVDIIPEALFRDTAATTFQESFRFVPGAFVRDRNAQFGSVNLRGFESGSGFATDGIRIGVYKRDLAGYERLEVVKGPPSSVQGRGGVGGLFNFILKKPNLDRSFTTLSATVGYQDSSKADFYRGTLDYNQVVDDKKAIRLGLVGQSSEDYLYFMKNKILGAYPSFRWKVSPRTEVIAVAEILYTNSPSREEGHGFNFYPANVRRALGFPEIYGAADQITSLNIPYPANPGGPDNTWIENTRALYLFLNQQIAEGIDFKQGVHLRHTDVDWQAWEITDNISRFQPIVLERQWNTLNVVNLQGDLYARFKPLDWLKTNTLVGYQIEAGYGTAGRDASKANEAQYAVLDLAAFAQDPIGYFSSPRTSTTPLRTSDNVLRTRNFGMYVQQDVEFFGRFILSGGLRSDKDRSATDRRVNRDVLSTASVLNSWRVAGTYKINKRLSVYAVKSVQNDPDFFGTQYNNLPVSDPRSSIFLRAPRQNDLQEFGLKGEVLDGRLTVTAAHWDLKRKGNAVTLTTNESYTDPVTGLPAIRAITQTLIADAQTKGWELAAFGNITPKLTLMTSYTNMSTQEPYTDPVTRVNGTRPLRFAPKWSYNLFSKYSFRDQKGKGWIVKAGTNWVGPMSIQVPNGTGIYAASRAWYPQSQHTFDVGAAYRIGRWEADLQVNNVGSDLFVITRDNPLRSFRFTLSTQY